MQDVGLSISVYLVMSSYLESKSKPPKGFFVEILWKSHNQHVTSSLSAYFTNVHYKLNGCAGFVEASWATEHYCEPKLLFKFSQLIF